MKKRRLCSICARGGSKGIKNKNLKNFCGKPLITHAIEIAQATQLFDAIAVSSDSTEILSLARAAGAHYLIERPIHLATDIAPKLPAIQHCAASIQSLINFKFDTFVDISVTSPLMLEEDIINAVKLLEEHSPTNVVSVKLAHSSPYFSMVEPKNDGFYQLVKPQDNSIDRRQDCPPCYDLNGAIYVWGSKDFFSLTKIITDKTLVYVMPADRSIDIDTELDFEFATFLYRKHKLFCIEE